MFKPKEYTFVSCEDHNGAHLITATGLRRTCCRVAKQKPIEHQFLGVMGSWSTHPEGKPISLGMRRWLDIRLDRELKKSKGG